MPNGPSRQVNRGTDQNRVLFGVCYPNRRPNRSASVCLFPNKPFCSAFCWAASFTDDAASGRLSEVARVPPQDSITLDAKSGRSGTFSRDRTRIP